METLARALLAVSMGSAAKTPHEKRMAVAMMIVFILFILESIDSPCRWQILAGCRVCHL